MAERALRGTRLGATSYENDRNTDLAPRREVAFDCPKGHHFSIPFAAEAEIPAIWECRVCGATAFTAAVDLMERRTIADLEEVLAERLAVIRERRGPRGDDRDARPGRGQQRKSA